MALSWAVPAVAWLFLGLRVVSSATTVGHGFVTSTNEATTDISLDILGIASQTANFIRVRDSTTATMFSVDSAGAIAKASGTFEIDHPSRGDGWRLRHSFVESARMDNVYTGTATLNHEALAAVNVDDAFRMTDGTFAALNRDPRVLAAGNGCAVRHDLRHATHETDTTTQHLFNKNNATVLVLRGDDQSKGDKMPWLCQPGDLVTYQLVAERKDPMVRKWQATDDHGNFIPEFRKEEGHQPQEEKTKAT